MSAMQDKVGMRFERFVVESLAPGVFKRSGGGFRKAWNCLCDCGNRFIARDDGLGTNWRSCGCLHKETASNLAYRHGGHGTPEYVAWADMKARCLTVTHKCYSDYGERGITVCDRWLESFDNFRQDMGTRPSKAHSLDRIDNNGNYDPSNCRWGTRGQQMGNRRCTIRLEVNGENLTIPEWSEKTGLAYKTLTVRIDAGWDPIDIVTKPSRNRPRL